MTKNTHIFRAAILVVLCLIFNTTFNLSAQIIEGPYGTQKFKEPAYEILDTAKLIAIYGHWMHDEVLDDDKYEDDILEIGNHSSLYSSYGSYRADSLFHAQHPDGGTNMMYFAALASIPNATHSKYTFKNHDDSLLSNNVRIGFNYYKYSEPVPEMSWEITDTTTNFQGIHCVKAKCHFRGRDWIAWFAPDIPISDGPWKFHGLPGLIVYAADSEKANVFSILELRSLENNGEIHQIKIVNYVNPFPTTREKALKREYEVAMDPRLLKEEGLVGDIDTDDFGQRLFYAPLELE